MNKLQLVQNRAARFALQCHGLRKEMDPGCRGYNQKSILYKTESLTRQKQNINTNRGQAESQNRDKVHEEHRGSGHGR